MGHPGGVRNGGRARPLNTYQGGHDLGENPCHDCICHRFLPLIRDLRDAQPCVTQPWYTKDAGVRGKFGDTLNHFKDMQARWPPRG